jgi:hypothetical protein
MIVALSQSTYLGPARVLSAYHNRVELAFPDQTVAATLALAYPYQPAVGDSVLAIGQDDNWYVIGVLAGTGPTTFVAPGDLNLVAPKGKVCISSSEAVEITAPTVRTVAGRLETVAHMAIEKFTEASRWVTKLFHLWAGETQVVTEGTCRLKAKRVLAQAEGEVKLNGDKILLG